MDSLNKTLYTIQRPMPPRIILYVTGKGRPVKVVTVTPPAPAMPEGKKGVQGADAYFDSFKD